MNKQEKLRKCDICGKKKCLPDEPICDECYWWIRNG